MKKTFIKLVGELIELHRCPRTGIAWIKDGKTGDEHTIHSNIDSTGSIKGMKKCGFWLKDIKTVRTHGAIYNINSVLLDKYEEILKEHCHCGGVHKTI